MDPSTSSGQVPNQAPNQSPTFPPNPVISESNPPLSTEATIPSPAFSPPMSSRSVSPPPTPSSPFTNSPSPFFTPPAPVQAGPAPAPSAGGLPTPTPAAEPIALKPAFLGPTAFNPPPANPTTDGPIPAAPPPGDNNGSLTVQSDRGKFPLMMVTILVIVIISGFSGSFLFFKFFGNKLSTTTMTPQITPPVEEEMVKKVTPEELAKYENPFALTDSKDNPFASESSKFENPFSAEESSSGAYQNPFD